MKRLLMNELLKWKNKKHKKPILLRGARQVGKSYLIKKFGKNYKNFFEINFEKEKSLCDIFNNSLTPEKIIKKLSIFFGKKIETKDTLIFFDEIQECERALLSLRYFYEEMPELDVVSAGSLLEFIIEKTGLPVGRIQNLYLYPMSFLEFLIAKEKNTIIDAIINGEIDNAIHNLIVEEINEYLTIGGMPEAIKTWIETEDIKEVKLVHNSIIDTYRQDFSKYSKNNQVEYVEKVFSKVPYFVGKKFVYSNIEDSSKIYKIKNAFELLKKAMVITPIYHSSSNGVPLEAEAKYKIFKTIFLDFGLMQTILGENTGLFILNQEPQVINKGSIIEAFIGQEILSYSIPYLRKKLFYWVREKRGSNAEVDYVEVLEGKVIPIEIKSGKKRYGRSINIFLNEKNSPYGIIFYNGLPIIKERTKLFPLYFTIKIFGKDRVVEL